MEERAGVRFVYCWDRSLQI